MPDVLGDGRYGRDDGIKCECGGKTYLVFDDGDGLLHYQCEECETSFGVQYEMDSYDYAEEYDFEFNPFDD